MNGAEVRIFIVGSTADCDRGGKVSGELYDGKNGTDRRERHFFDELVSITELLRSPEGCPWDREQKLEDLRAYIVEEAYELAEAITERDMNNVREESGDLLLQIVFAASLAKEEKAFGIEDVVRTVCDKLVRRHPHVFRDVAVENSDDVMRNWEQIKQEERREKKQETSLLAGVPKGLPPLVKAYRMQGKAAHVGFDWQGEDTSPLFAKLEEEIQELREALASGDADGVEDELGDLLFMTVNLARHVKVNPDAALSRACGKFASRLRKVEGEAEARGLRLNECSPEELDELWRRAKKNEASSEV
ncbi:MAG: nucleoside triphosphate pyrophosphohydrolase [Synergistaceae bacterium]|jgi:MazG family protein|nr:nucleoside triphosphate pyrophosphohydrolase [Synergistaceae bacterium]